MLFQLIGRSLRFNLHKDVMVLLSSSQIPKCDKCYMFLNFAVQEN